MREQIDVAVIGAGQAGLVMSWHLRALGIEHLVLERSRVAERWRTQRWDSLRFQFPNYSLELPGQRYESAAPDSFAGRDEVVGFIERYAQRISAPVRCGVDVLALGQDGACGPFLLDTPPNLICHLRKASSRSVGSSPLRSPPSQSSTSS